MKNLAEEKGINLEDFLNSMNDRMSKGKAYGKPGMQQNSTILSLLNGLNTDSEKSDLMSLFSQVAESTKDGTFDASVILEQVPESILSAAGSENIDLGQLFNELSAKITSKMAE